MDNFPYIAVLSETSDIADVNQQRWVWLYKHIGGFNKDWTWGYADGKFNYRFKTQEEHALFVLTWL